MSNTLKRKDICTERAHYMCPNMNFGIAVDIAKTYDEDKIYEAIGKLKDAHPLLSMIVDETVSYNYSNEVSVPVTFMEDYQSMIDDYEKVTKRGWDLRKDSMLRLITYAHGDNTFIIFVAHHLLCDGKALLDFALQFADIYVNGSEARKYEDRIIESSDEFMKRLKLPFMVRCIIDSANKKWRSKAAKVSYDSYRQFEISFLEKTSKNYNVSSMEPDMLSNLHDKCKELGVTVNDYLIAQMMIEDNTDTVLIGADIRKYYEEYELGSLGNYSSAYSVNVKKRTDDVWKLAAVVSKKVRKIKGDSSKELLTLSLYNAMEPELLDAAAVSVLGDFKSEAGLFVGDRMLGFKNGKNHTITNLGKLESNIIDDAYFIPPFSPSAKKMAGVITINGKMNTVTFTSN